MIIALKLYENRFSAIEEFFLLCKNMRSISRQKDKKKILVEEVIAMKRDITTFLPKLPVYLKDEGEDIIKKMEEFLDSEYIKEILKEELKPLNESLNKFAHFNVSMTNVEREKNSCECIIS